MKKIIIITLLATLIPALLFALMGCMKAPPVNMNFGPEASPDEINLAKNSAMAVSVLDMKINESSSYDVTVKFESLSSVTTYQVAEKVTDKKDMGNYIHYVIARKNNKWENGKWVPWTDEYSIDADKPAAKPIPNPTPPPVPAGSLNFDFLASNSYPRNTIYPEGLSNDFIAQNLKAMDTSAPTKITYHNLHKAAVDIPFPLYTMSKPDCGGVPADKCGLPLKGWAISYDKILHYDNSWDKQSWIYYISGDVPYLAGLITACVSGTIKITDTAIGTLQCQELKDFQYGQ